MSEIEDQPRRGQPRVPSVNVAPAGEVTIPLAAVVTGLSEKAIRRKIEEGVWREGREYHRGPDGHIYVDLGGYGRWVRGDADAA